jgi:2-methylcitrate dehydratase PrpD
VSAIDGTAVGEIAAGMRWASLPPDVRERAGVALRDTVGTLVAGRGTLAARAAAAAVAADGGDGPVHVLSSGRRAGRIAGALANAVAATSLDFDDGHVLGGSIHPGGAIVPALLATGADRDVTLEQVAEALVVAYEVAIRAGYLLWPEDRSHQAHLAGTPAAIGGAVGCAKLMGADAAGLRRALEIGWAHAPLAALQFPMVKESLGWAAATSVAAALLAAAGFKDAGAGGRDAFGYAAHPPTGFDRPGAGDPFVSSFGSVWEIENTYVKPYAACRFTHTAADAVLELMADGIAPGDVTGIVVATHREAAYLDGRRPGTIEEAQYSFPWVVACAVLEGEVTPQQINPERLRDGRLVDLADRVRVVHDPALDASYPEQYPSRVTLELQDGRRVESRVDDASGSPERPLGEERLQGKFRRLTEDSLGGGDAAHLGTALAGAEGTLADVLERLSAVRPA